MCACVPLSLHLPPLCPSVHILSAFTHYLPLPRSLSLAGVYVCVCILVFYFSPSLLCPSIARSLFLTTLHIFLFFTFFLVCTHSFLSILFRHPSFYHSPFCSGDFQCVSSLSLSLFWLHFIYLSFTLSLSQSCFLHLQSVISLPLYVPHPSPSRKFIVSFRAVTPSLSLHLVGICSVSLSLVYSSYLFVLRTPVCLRTHTYARRIFPASNTNERTHANIHAHARLVKSTNTSQYEWLVHARERDRVT